jgi:hypothetical protein
MNSNIILGMKHRSGNSIAEIVSRVAALLLVQFICSLTVLAQESGQLIKTEYDASKNFTNITLNPFILASRKLEELRLGAITGYPGKVKTKPKAIALVFLSLSKMDENRYDTVRKLTVVADERRFDWGETQRSKQAQKDLFIETLSTAIPIDDFLFVIGAKRVRLRLGLTEVDLTADQMKLLRLLASYMIE